MSQFKNTNFYLMLLADATVFAIAFIGSYLLRFEFQLTPLQIEQIEALFPYILLLKLSIFYLSTTYISLWRYTSLIDLLKLSRACMLAEPSVVIFVLFKYRFEGFSLAVFVIDGFLTFLFSGGLRSSIRLCYSIVGKQSITNILLVGRNANKRRGCKRLILIGAGDAGDQILREISRDPHHLYHVVGFLDDNPMKIGRSVHGVPVLGSVEEMHYVTRAYDIHMVLIAIPSISGTRLRHIVELCEMCGVQYKTLPELSKIIDGRVSINDLRNVDYEDILRRPTVKIDTHKICNYLSGKVVVVTGCGGSIGSELCRQIVRFQPQNLILIDACEENLFNTQMELHNELDYQDYRGFLCRAQNRSLMKNIFKRYSPEVVFHAAAYKHVPMMELNPWEAFFNNILASLTVMEISEKYAVKRFVLVSSDKAVRPTNVMGASKRVTELLLQTFQECAMRVMAVRFGNVIGSSGSVVPLFKRQIERGGPVTVTHPEITRFFMTIPEAAQLILQAGAMGKGGEIFILKMGAAIKILDMAKDLVKLMGKEPGKDVEIVISGLRAGEKLYEELITENEEVVETEHEKILALRSNGKANGNESPEEIRSWLTKKLDELYYCALDMNSEAIKAKLKEIVPEYRPQSGLQIL